MRKVALLVSGPRRRVNFILVVVLTFGASLVGELSEKYRSHFFIFRRVSYGGTLPYVLCALLRTTLLDTSLFFANC